VDASAWQLIRLLDDVANLVAAAVSACTLHRDRSVDVGGTLRRVVFAVAEADGLRETIYAQRASDLYHGRRKTAAGERRDLVERRRVGVRR